MGPLSPANRRRGRLLWIALTCLGLATRAHAGPATLESVYEGAAWFLTQPGDLLAVLALALLIGQRGERENRLALVLAPTLWLLAGLFARLFLPPGTWTLTPFLLVVLGLLVAVRAPVPSPGLTLLAGIAGLLAGLADGVALKAIPLHTVALAGVALLVAPLLALVAVITTPARAPWMRITIQVAGSWIVAIGMLMVGWLLRGAIR